MIDKISFFGSMKKQQKVVNDKLDYDDKLSDVQDSLQEAYDQIKAFLEKTIDESEVTNANNIIDNNYSEICKDLCIYKYIDDHQKKDYIDGWPRTSAVKNSSAKVSKDTTNENVRDFLIAAANLYNEEEGVFEKWKEEMSAYQTNLGWGVENYKSMDGMVSGWEKKTLDPDKKISNEVYVAKILNYWKSYSKAYTTESDPDNYELISKMHTDIEKDCQNYNVGVYAAFYKNQIEEFVNDDAKAVYDCLSALHSKLTDVGGYLDDAIEALDDAEEEEQELEALKNQWVSDAEKLPDGQVKQNMVNEASTRTEKLDHEKLEALQQVLGNMKNSYENCLTQLESEKFNSKVLYNYSGSDFFSNYI